MKHLRKNGGFTLVELVISIAVASLVTMAATTVLMLALRVNRQTADTATQQYTVRALLTTMEKAATNGNIKEVETKLGSWRMWKAEDGETTPVFEYDAFKRQILSNGIVVMKDVYASNAILENGLLSISLETREGIFETTVYCRLGSITPEGTTPTRPDDLKPSVDTFLTILLSQLNSDGVIKNGLDAGKYYSEWYIGGYENDLRWNPSTPWCACYVSWALTEAGFPGPVEHPKWYANVEEFRNHFSALIDTPTIGALVFFNFDDDSEADHIGVVYGTGTDDEGNEIIITIEGNSAGHVAVRSYPLTDARILGYGVLFE